MGAAVAGVTGSAGDIADGDLVAADAWLGAFGAGSAGGFERPQPATTIIETTIGVHRTANLFVACSMRQPDGGGNAGDRANQRRINHGAWPSSPVRGSGALLLVDQNNVSPLSSKAAAPALAL